MFRWRKKNSKKTIDIRGKSLRRLIAVFIFMAVYIPMLPQTKAVYALESVSGVMDAAVYFYAKNPSEGSVYTGDYYRVHMLIANLKSTKEIPDFDFVTVKLPGDAVAVLQELKAANTDFVHISGGTLYTGWSHKLHSRDVTVAGKRVNFQLFVKDGDITLGCPAIYGAY